MIGRSYLHPATWNCRLPWPTLSTLLQELPHDVVVFLDACSAAAAVGASSAQSICQGRMEIIAACGHNINTTAPIMDSYANRGRKNFSDVLRDELNSKLEANQPFSAVTLHRDLLRRTIQNEVELGNDQHSMPSPVYICVNGAVGEPSIVMGMMPVGSHIEEPEASDASSSSSSRTHSLVDD